MTVSWGREGLPRPIPPTGYQPYGGPSVPQGTNGFAIASLTLSLVGLVPCFWLFQVPALLGAIFGFIALGPTKNGQKGRGMAIAGVGIGCALSLLCFAFWFWVFVQGSPYKGD